MFEDILSNRMYYERKMNEAEIKLERAKISNEQSDKLRAELDVLLTLISDVKKHRNNLLLLQTAATKETNEFQNRRIEYLNDMISAALAEIFPDEGYVAKICCDFSRKEVCELILYDSDGHESMPDISEGKLMQYLISFAAVSGITKGLGCSNLFIDEAFGVSDIDRLPELGKAIQKQVQSGMQVILISQNSALYAELPRHVINLHKDIDTKRVVVDSEEDI